MSLPCYRPGRTVPTPSESPAFGPHRLPGRVPFGLRRGIRLSPCNVAGKEVDSKTEKYGKVEEYPQEENSNGGFFPTRDPGAWPPVEMAATAKTTPVAEEEEEFDPLRDGPLRYLGYANECGEAFAAWLPPFGVPLSYAIAVGYVFTDTGDKFFKAYKKADKELGSMAGLNSTVDTGKLTKLLAGERAVDTVVWQLLASVIIPGATIHVIVAVVHSLLSSGLRLDTPDDILPLAATFFATVAATLNVPTDTVAEIVEKSVPTFCGLLAIPFIVHPIDTTVHAILNVSMRPAMRQFLCEQGQGRLAGMAICEEACIQKDFPILNKENTIVDAFRASFDENETE